MSEVNARSGGFEYRESGGYDRAQVDSFINEVKKYIAGQKNEKQLLTQKLHVLAVKIQEYQAFEKENGSLEQRIASLKKECKALEENSAELKASCEALRGEIEAKNAELSEKKAAASEAEASLEALKSQAFGLDGAIKAKSAELSAIEAKVAGLKTEEGNIIALAAEEQNKKSDAIKASVDEKLAGIAAYVNGAIAEIEAVLAQAPVVTVEYSAPAPKAEAAPAVVAQPLTVASLLEEDEPEAAAETEPTEEEMRSSRDAAKSMLRSVAGFEDEDENGPTKVMPEGIDKVGMISSGAPSVDIVINASEEEPEETGWCAPEDSVDEENEPEAAPEVKAEEKKEESTVTVLTAEEAEGLSYDDALALVLKKNGIDYKPNEKKAEPEEISLADAAPEKKPEPVAEAKPKKEKKGFFAALKRNIDAILEDDDEDEEEEFTGTEIFTPDAKNAGEDQPTLRFGRDQNGKTK